jgi:hypothetical protein
VTPWSVRNTLLAVSGSRLDQNVLQPYEPARICSTNGADTLELNLAIHTPLPVVSLLGEAHFRLLFHRFVSFESNRVPGNEGGC